MPSPTRAKTSKPRTTRAKKAAPHKWQQAQPELVELFLATTGELTNIEPRKMFGYPCAFVHGNMFTGLHEAGMIIRLPESDRTEFLKLKGAHVFEPMPGRFMREYVVVPAQVLKVRSELRRWLDRSQRYAATLPPKAKSR